MSQDDFTLEARWPTPPADGERDVAQIALFADDEVLTRLSDFDLKEERAYVRGSGVSLAFWLADNWWRLRFESLPNSARPSVSWRLRHEMTSAAGGVLWPPVMIHSTGDRIQLAPVTGRPMDFGAVRYVATELKSVTADAFEQGLDRFFEAVSTACPRAADGAALVTLLEDLRDERADPDVRAWRRLEQPGHYGCGRH